MSSILGVDVQRSRYDEVVTKCLQWAKQRESRALVFANVHVIMEAFDDPKLRDDLNQADLVNPDGMPLVWALRLLGKEKASRVYGPDCTLSMMEAAEAEGIPVGFYGGSPEVLEKLTAEVHRRYPKLQIQVAISPPFRPLSEVETTAYLQEMTDSGARIVFVGLGCPKQERWMMRNYKRVPAVMFAVGAAFDFIAGTKQQAPVWMRSSGLEWVHRLSTEPRRLFKRYLKQNPRFIYYFTRQLLLGASRS